SSGGALWPMSAEGMREASPAKRRAKNKIASAPKISSGVKARRRGRLFETFSLKALRRLRAARGAAARRSARDNRQSLRRSSQGSSPRRWRKPRRRSRNAAGRSCARSRRRELGGKPIAPRRGHHAEARDAPAQDL